jgi:RNA 3'-terminal phosphate cyclase
MLTIDGSSYSGSGTIVRQAVAFSALTGIPVHLVHARAKRSRPGLRRQHRRVIEAIRELVNGRTEGVSEGSQEIFFAPGPSGKQESYRWDIGSAGSTTMLALGVLPVLALKPTPTEVEIRGGLFQDFAPSVFHLQHVLCANRKWIIEIVGPTRTETTSTATVGISGSCSTSLGDCPGLASGGTACQPTDGRDGDGTIVPSWI